MSTIHWVGGLPGKYNIASGSNWIGGIAPGTLDIGMLDASQVGPYSLTGNLTLGELSVLGDQATILGTITASDLLSTELSVTGGGTLAIAAGGNFSGNDIVQMGTRADGTTTRWTFTEITAHSFHWLGEALQPDGITWKLEGEFRAKRRTF